MIGSGDLFNQKCYHVIYFPYIKLLHLEPYLHKTDLRGIAIKNYQLSRSPKGWKYVWTENMFELKICLKKNQLFFFSNLPWLIFMSKSSSHFGLSIDSHKIEFFEAMKVDCRTVWRTTLTFKLTYVFTCEKQIIWLCLIYKLLCTQFVTYCVFFFLI